jgi:hypothetical protein
MVVVVVSAMLVWRREIVERRRGRTDEVEGDMLERCGVSQENDEEEVVEVGINEASSASADMTDFIPCACFSTCMQAAGWATNSQGTARIDSARTAETRPPHNITTSFPMGKLSSREGPHVF